MLLASGLVCNPSAAALNSGKLSYDADFSNFRGSVTTVSWCLPLQDRVTDHRVGVTLHGLEELMSGEGGSAQALDTVIDALAVQEQTRTLEELAECAA